MMCLTSTMSGWRKRRSNFTSRKMRVASLTWSNTLLIFLMATLSPIVLSMAEQTTP